MDWNQARGKIEAHCTETLRGTQMYRPPSTVLNVMWHPSDSEGTDCSALNRVGSKLICSSPTKKTKQLRPHHTISAEQIWELGQMRK